MIKLTPIIQRYFRNQSGIAAVEFALILPVLSLMMFGGYSIYRFVETDRAIERTSEITADLVSRMSKIDDSTVDDMIEIAESLVGDNANDPSFKITMSSISNTFDTDNDYDLEINWSFANDNGAALQESQIPSFDIPYIPEGESVVLVNVELDHSPLLYKNHFGTFSVSQASVRRPRLVPQITYE